MNTGTSFNRYRYQLVGAGIGLLALPLAGCGGGDALNAEASVSQVGARETALALTAVADPSVVTVAGGALKGTVASTYRSFLGIAYAAPPVGALRWKVPAAAARWTGTRAATAPGNMCPQPGADSSGNPAIVGAEDCLYLNVYTPQPTSAQKLPIMVWLHGGGYVAGSGSVYDASVLSAKANAVVVTLNYRLGALGYLAHAALAAENKDAAGNYGLLDQQAALKWVKANGAAFGGDVSRVTIFGGSAGGASVWANIASPSASGLFTRAIVQSGPDTTAPLANAEAYGLGYAATVGCAGTSSAAASCLRALPAAQLVAAQVGSAMGPVPGFEPATGGTVLPKSAKAAVTAGAFNKVAILQGTNHDEGRLFAAMQFDLVGNPLTAASYSAVVNQMFGPASASVLTRYPAASYATPSLAYAAVLTDSVFACPARTLNRLVAGRVPLYAYEFNDPDAPVNFQMFGFPPSTPAPFPMLAYHGSETPYIFQGANTSNLTTAQLALSNQMIKYWAGFAAAGVPQGVPAWAPYVPAFDAVQSLAPQATGIDSHFASDHQCAFWSGLGI